MRRFSSALRGPCWYLYCTVRLPCQPDRERDLFLLLLSGVIFDAGAILRSRLQPNRLDEEATLCQQSDAFAEEQVPDGRCWPDSASPMAFSTR
jgi:hypothetical protein